MKSKKVRVKRVKNRSGSVSWRVSGTIHGIRFRKNYSGREAADAAANAKEIERVNSLGEVRTVATRLTIDQLAQAEASIQLLKGTNSSLIGAVEFFRTNYTEPSERMPVMDAVADYVATREADFENGEITFATIRDIRHYLKAFAQHFEGEDLSALTHPCVVDCVTQGSVSMKTKNNRRGMVSAFFSHARVKGWTTLKPFEGVKWKNPKKGKGQAVILSSEESQAFMTHVESYEGGAMVPFFALALFAGIRPDVFRGEMSKLKPGDIDLGKKVINIRPSVSKIDEQRDVPIQPNLAKWLRRYPVSKYPIRPKGFDRMHREIRAHAKLGHDVLRHSFCTYRLAITDSLGRVASEAGNSEQMIRTHYKGRTTKAEAERFWSIVPVT